MTTRAETEVVDVPTSLVARPFSAVPGLLVLALLAFLGVKLLIGGDGGDMPRPKAPAAAPARNAPADPVKDVSLPARNVPLRPPPSNACVNGRDWCDKQIGYASIIVDVGYRTTNLPKRAWVIAVATAMQESSLKNQATEAYPETKQFPYDKIGSDHDSVGLFQQRPSQGWGTPSELMNPHIAASRFYDKLAKKVKGWNNWEDPSKVRLTDIAQKVQNSGFPDAYQKHEKTAIKIVNLVLRYQYVPKFYRTNVMNKWFVMVQCSKPRARACQSMPWQPVQPVVDNYDAFEQAFPKAELNAHLGDWRHENDKTPQDHTPIGQSCFGKKCNVLGWVYAQDFGNGNAKGTGFDLNRFVRWLLDELRAHPQKYPELKYVISTIPANRGVDGNKYYGIFMASNNWKPEPSSDHDKHVHLSYKPGFERKGSTVIADYLKSKNSK